LGSCIVAIVCWVIVEIFKARSKESKFEDLEKLHKLRDSGTLSDEEFLAMKSKILKI
jgi:hypothetical protein